MYGASELWWAQNWYSAVKSFKFHKVQSIVVQVLKVLTRQEEFELFLDLDPQFYVVFKIKSKRRINFLWLKPYFNILLKVALLNLFRTNATIQLDALQSSEYWKAWRQGWTMVRNGLRSINCSPVFSFFTLGKCHKTFGSLTFSEAIEMESWAKMG